MCPSAYLVSGRHCGRSRCRVHPWPQSEPLHDAANAVRLGDISSLHTGRHNAALYHQTLTAQLRGLALASSAADRSAIEISPAQKRRNIQRGGGSTRASEAKFTNALWPNGVPDTTPRRAVHKVGTVSTTHSSPFLLLY